MMFNIYLPVVIGAVMLILAKPIGVDCGSWLLVIWDYIPLRGRVSLWRS